MADYDKPQDVDAEDSLVAVTQQKMTPRMQVEHRRNRRELILKLVRRGVRSIAELTRQVRAEGFKTARKTVESDLDWIAAKLAKENAGSMRHFLLDAMAMEQRLALAGFERSTQSKQSKTVKQKDVVVKGEKVTLTEVTESSVGQAGDAAFLREYRQAAEFIARLTGDLREEAVAQQNNVQVILRLPARGDESPEMLANAEYDDNGQAILSLPGPGDNGSNGEKGGSDGSE